LEDDLRPEYDFSKMKLVGRGIFAERFRSGMKVILLDESEGNIDRNKSEQGNSRPERDFGKVQIVRRGPRRKKAGQ